MTQPSQDIVAVAELTAAERRFLRRRACGWCDAPLTADCQAMYGEKCSPEFLAERRAKALLTYKPRTHLIECGK